MIEMTPFHKGVVHCINFLAEETENQNGTD